MSEPVMTERLTNCDQCGRHCPAEDLHCNRGRARFGLPPQEEKEGECGHGREHGDHGHGHNHGHRHEHGPEHEHDHGPEHGPEHEPDHDRPDGEEE